jgi:arginine decarboxylase
LKERTIRDSIDLYHVLAYVQYERRPLIEKVRRIIESALRNDNICLEESARLLERYEQGLKGYTYLSGQA